MFCKYLIIKYLQNMLQFSIFIINTLPEAILYVFLKIFMPEILQNLKKSDR